MFYLPYCPAVHVWKPQFILLEVLIAIAQNKYMHALWIYKVHREAKNPRALDTRTPLTMKWRDVKYPNGKRH